MLYIEWYEYILRVYKNLYEKMWYKRDLLQYVI